MLRRRKDILKDNGVIIPPKEVIAEELEFDEKERKFYNDLQERGKDVIEKLQSKGGLQKSYMCLVTMLLRLRQATDHIDLLKGKLESDPEEDLADLMSGLGIGTKCNVCYKVYSPLKF